MDFCLYYWKQLNIFKVSALTLKLHKYNADFWNKDGWHSWHWSDYYWSFEIWNIYCWSDRSSCWLFGTTGGKKLKICVFRKFIWWIVYLQFCGVLCRMYLISRLLVAFFRVQISGTCILWAFYFFTFTSSFGSCIWKCILVICNCSEYFSPTRVKYFTLNRHLCWFDSLWKLEQ